MSAPPLSELKYPRRSTLSAATKPEAPKKLEVPKHQVPAVSIFSPWDFSLMCKLLVTSDKIILTSQDPIIVKERGRAF